MSQMYTLSLHGTDYIICYVCLLTLNNLEGHFTFPKDYYVIPIRKIVLQHTAKLALRALYMLRKIRPSVCPSHSGIVS